MEKSPGRMPWKCFLRDEKFQKNGLPRGMVSRPNPFVQRKRFEGRQVCSAQICWKLKRIFDVKFFVFAVQFSPSHR